jgi:hypothetical protein
VPGGRSPGLTSRSRSTPVTAQSALAAWRATCYSGRGNF